jgi:hypothetical protein
MREEDPISDPVPVNNDDRKLDAEAGAESHHQTEIPESGLGSEGGDAAAPPSSEHDTALPEYRSAAEKGQKFECKLGTSAPPCTPCLCVHVMAHITPVSCIVQT